jgi:hypothetical protein
MLELIVHEKEFYQQDTNKFIQIPECTLTLEHSLISLAKWESKWAIPYFSEIPKTPKQDLDYIRCMVVGNIKDNRIFEALSATDIHKIQKYIAAPMTATTFTTPTKKSSPKKEVMTAEVIYAHMFAHRISIECQKWHLNRLLTLLKVCDLQNAPKEKLSKKQTAMWNAEQNAARRAKYNTRG